MNYKAELEFISEKIVEAFNEYREKGLEIFQKSKYDLVTDTDKDIEEKITALIKERFPEDGIRGEEFTSDTCIKGRMWTIDPIDGTCNMANGINIYGVQCALLEDSDIVLSVIYLPFEGEIYTASVGSGAYKNGRRISVSSSVDTSNAVISYGDYPHRASSKVSDIQNNSIKNIYTSVAKIRMFGAACYDFAYVASGRTHGTALTTVNLWDLAPGILLCKEAGAIVTDLNGDPWKPGAEGVIAAANEEIASLMLKGYKNTVTLEINGVRRSYAGFIFDFDGVVMDTEKYHYLSWKQSFDKYSCPLTKEEYLPLKSTGGKYITDNVPSYSGKTLTEEQKKDVLDTKDELFTEMCRLLSYEDFVPGALEFIGRLNGALVKTAVASSSRTTTPFFNKFELQRVFDYKVDGNTPLPRKPDPALFLNAAENIFTDPAKCIVFEDSIAGIQAAKRAGMDVIAIGGIKSDDALICVEDFTSIIPLIASEGKK